MGELAEGLAAGEGDELDKAGLPARQVLKIALEEAEKLGHKWPVRYPIEVALPHAARQRRRADLGSVIASPGRSRSRRPCSALAAMLAFLLCFLVSPM